MTKSILREKIMDILEKYSQGYDYIDEFEFDDIVNDILEIIE